MDRVYDFFRRLLRSNGYVSIDNFIFRQHCMRTVYVLALFITMLSYQNFLCERMECRFDNTDGTATDVHCFKKSTYPVTHDAQGVEGVAVTHSEVTTGESGEEGSSLDYYWVIFVLVIQSFQFTLPYLIWKMWEGGRMMMLVEDGNTPAVGTEERNAKKNRLVQYFLSNFHNQDSYAYVFFACEMFNFFNAWVNVLLIDRLLGEDFITYGDEVLEPTVHDPEQGSGATSRVLPKVIRCPYNLLCLPVLTFDGLTLHREDYLYVLIYVSLRLLFICLFILSNVAIFVSTTLVTAPPSWNATILRIRAGVLGNPDADVVCRACNIGDWFLLYQLGGNLDPQFYEELLAELATRLADN